MTTACISTDYKDYGRKEYIVLSSGQLAYSVDGYVLKKLVRITIPKKKNQNQNKENFYAKTNAIDYQMKLNFLIL